MGFKEQNWEDYKKNKGEIVEFIIRDRSGAKTGRFKANNQKDYERVLKLISDKIGYKPRIEQAIQDEVQEEINFLKGNIKW